MLFRSSRDKSLANTTSQTVYISIFQGSLREKNLLRIYLAFAKLLSARITTSNILKINLCNVFTDWLAHHTQGN